MTNLQITKHQDLFNEHEAIGLVYYTKKEEILNTVSHGIGAPVAFAIMIYLLIIANSALEIATAFLLCIPAIQVFVTSAVYHGLVDKKKKFTARKIDHANVSFLVTACGVPAGMLFSSGIFGYIAIGLCFTLSIINAILCITNLMKYKKLGVVFDVIIALILFITYLISYNTSIATTTVNALFLAGLICCIIGLILFGLKKIHYAHTVFHFCTLIGPILFFVGTIFIYKAS